MGEYYGLDLSRPAHSAQEAVQWVYMAYLAAVKEQDGAAMSLGNVSSFLDIFIEYDLAHGNIDEVFAQELIDQFVIKLRMVRHLRMQSYNDKMCIRDSPRSAPVPCRYNPPCAR